MVGITGSRSAQLVAEVATAEGPVHLDEVVVRIRSAWNLQRSGSRIQSAVDAAVAHAVRSNNVVVAGSFIWKQGAEVRVRDRSSVSSSNLRKPELLPPSELRECIVKVMTASLGATEDEIVQAALRMLGFKSISSQLREAVQGQIGQLVLAGELVRRNSYLGLAKSS